MKTQLLSWICLLIFLTVTLLPAPSDAQRRRVGNYIVDLPEPQQVDLPPPTSEALDLWHDFYFSSDLQGRDDTQVPRDAYHAILRIWSKQMSPDALVLYREFEARLAPVRYCELSTVDHTMTHLETVAPGSSLVAVLLHMQAWKEDLQDRRYTFISANLNRIRQWTTASAAARGKTPRARRESAQVLTYLADLIWDSGFANLLPLGEQILDDALDLDPEAFTARYLRVMTAEKLGHYKKAYRDLQKLQEQHPDRRDITLRLGIQAARIGKDRLAGEAFERVIASRKESGINKVEEWVRILAFQERIRLETYRPEHIPGILVQARNEYPSNVRFVLQEIEQHRRKTLKPSLLSQSLLEQRTADTGPTPRLRYLQGPLDAIDANRRSLNEALVRLAPTLPAALNELEEGGPSLDCLGMWPRLIPRESQETREAKQTKPPQYRPPLPTPPQGPTVADTTLPQAEPILTPEMPPAQASAEEQEARVYVDPETGQRIIVHDAVDLDLQTIYASPANFFGRRLSRDRASLKREDITVLDDGREQEIVTFTQGEVPFTATLLLDASGSMQGPRLRQALQGAHAFVERMGPLDRARLVIAADRLRGVSEVVSVDDSLETLTARLDTARADGGTALYDHLLLTVDALQPELGRKVVIVLSDGFDMMSVVPMTTVLEAVRRSQVQLYWVRLREGIDDYEFIPPTGWRPVGESAKEMARLERAVKTSGGHVLEIGDTDEAVDAFERIVADLRAQIAVGYYATPAQDDGRWREVEIKTKRRGVRLRHAAGYFDE